MQDVAKVRLVRILRLLLWMCLPAWIIAGMLFGLSGLVVVGAFGFVSIAIIALQRCSACGYPIAKSVLGLGLGYPRNYCRNCMRPFDGSTEPKSGLPGDIH